MEQFLSCCVYDPVYRRARCTPKNTGVLTAHCSRVLTREVLLIDGVETLEGVRAAHQWNFEDMLILHRGYQTSFPEDGVLLFVGIKINIFFSNSKSAVAT